MQTPIHPERILLGLDTAGLEPAGDGPYVRRGDLRDLINKAVADEGFPYRYEVFLGKKGREFMGIELPESLLSSMPDVEGGSSGKVAVERIPGAHVFVHKERNLWGMFYTVNAEEKTLYFIDSSATSLSLEAAWNHLEASQACLPGSVGFSCRTGFDP